MTVLDLARESEPVPAGLHGTAVRDFSTYTRNRTKRRGGNGTN
jgi:hypothetical protein